MKKTLLAAIAAAAIVLSAGSRSEAAVLLDYVAVPTDAKSSNPVSPGTTITYDIYFRETLTAGSNELINATGGLFGAGFYISLASGSGTVITSVAFDPSFGTQLNGSLGPTGQRNITATQARLGENNGATNVLLTSVSATEYHAKLGTLTLQANSGSTTFDVSSYINAPKGAFGGSGANGNTLFGPADLSKFYDADITNNGNNADKDLVYTGANSLPATQFTVNVATPVPEPSSMILGTALMLGGFGAYRRRHAAAAAKA